MAARMPSRIYNSGPDQVSCVSSYADGEYRRSQREFRYRPCSIMTLVGTRVKCSRDYGTILDINGNDGGADSILYICCTWKYTLKYIFLQDFAQDGIIAIRAISNIVERHNVGSRLR